MMHFLRSLAPHQGNARHRAVAAVRSRYEAERPMQSVASAADGHEREFEPEPQAIDASVPPASQARPAAPSAATAEDAARLTRRHVVRSGARPLSGQRTEAPSLINIQSPSTHIVDAHRPVVRDVVNEPPRPAALVAMSGGPKGLLPGHIAIDRSASSQAVAAVHVPTMPERTRRTSDSGGPLSRQAVMSRVEQQSERRPVVHVTIDRIDVRAPAVPERTAPRSRPRQTSSGSSLTEYLRTRQPGRSGGTS